jgi:hypothetical protein
MRPPEPGPDTTLLVTDIASSTTLWEELDADVMDEAMQAREGPGDGGCVWTGWQNGEGPPGIA